MIKNINFRRVNAIYKGGATQIPDSPAEFQKQYPESNCFGILPAAGYYIRHGKNITFEDCNTIIALPDCRETFVTEDVENFSTNNII